MMAERISPPLHPQHSKPPTSSTDSFSPALFVNLFSSFLRLYVNHQMDHNDRIPSYDHLRKKAFDFPPLSNESRFGTHLPQNIMNHMNMMKRNIYSPDLNDSFFLFSLFR